MIKTIKICDFCGTEEQDGKSWEHDFRPLTIHTETACTNPMSRHAKGFQQNTTKFEHLCYDCQRKAANALANLIDSLKSNSGEQARSDSGVA